MAIQQTPHGVTVVDDICGRPLMDDDHAVLVFVNAGRARRKAATLGWERRPRKGGQPGLDLCRRCAYTESRREGL